MSRPSRAASTSVVALSAAITAVNFKLISSILASIALNLASILASWALNLASNLAFWASNLAGGLDPVFKARDAVVGAGEREQQQRPGDGAEERG